MNTDAILKGNVLHDITHWGLRASIGVIFIVHSLKKFDPSWQEWLISVGIPPEIQLPILDKSFARLDLIAHQGSEDVIGFYRVLKSNLQQGTPFRVHGCIPQLLWVHFA